MKKIFHFSIVAFLLMTLNACRKDTPGSPTPDPPPTGGSNPVMILPKKEMRAAWMATVWGLDWPEAKYTVAAQKKHYTDYLDKFKELNMNAVFVQVKGMGDAFYNSPYEPWSASITGSRGTDPGYDVLKFMIDEAHTRGMEFHAWMNPYRIATRASASSSYPALHASVKPEWVVSHEKIQIYNPALPEVRQRLSDIVKDVITKYEVDGIHFDDYFYPDPSSAGQMVSDDADYQKYGAGLSTKEAFRRDNVDKAIKGVYDVIVATKPSVVFSVSPAPDPDYNYKTLFADVKKWNEAGWLDVVMPQLYQEIGNPYNDFQNRLTWWSQYSYKAALMVGHGYYKFGDGISPAAFQSTTELGRQFELTRRNNKVVGNVMYSARYIMLNRIGITTKLAELYRNIAVMPFIGRSIAPPPTKPSNVKLENGILKWSTTNNDRSVIYFTGDLQKEALVLGITTNNEWPVNANGHYAVSAINKDNKESALSIIVEKK